MSRLHVTINPARFRAAENLDTNDVAEILHDLAYRLANHDLPAGVTVPLISEGEQVGEATYCLASERHDPQWSRA